MAFSREDLAAYEQQAQEVIADVPAASEQEPSQPEAAASEDSSASETTDQTESGDVTSDETEAASTSNATDSESEEGETEGEPEGESTEGEESTNQPQTKQSRASKRIQELNAKALEASDLAEGYKEFGKLTQQQLQAVREENERLRKQLAGNTATTAPAAEAKTSPAVADKLGPMPKLTDPDINFDPDLLAQKVEEWTDKKVKLTVQEALRQNAGQSQVQKVVETFKSRVAEFEKATPDWKEKVGNPELPKLNEAAQSVIVKSDLGPAIVYHLASNIAEAKRIAAMAPEDQVMEMGVLKARLESAAKPAAANSKTPVTPAKVVVKKSVSQAPPPPTPVPAGKRSQARDLTDPNLDMEDFARRHREAKHNARLASRQLRGLK